MTYLRNSDIVRAFKAELVRQFYAMRQELMNVRAVKSERRLSRLTLTDAISALPDSPHKAMKYIQYTNLAYMLALGVTAKKLREERGADRRAVASNYMTAKELQAVAVMENRIAVLIGIGMTYQAIKTALAAKRLTA